MGATPHIYAASIGIQDSVFLMFLALIVFGPRRLPEIGRQIGKLMYEFRKVSNDFKFQMEEELRAAEEADRQRKLQASLPPPTAADTPAESSAIGPAAEAQPSAAPAEPASSKESHESANGAPQIQPPSTGEPVAAARPFRASQPAQSESSQETSGEPAQGSHAEEDSEVISPLAYGSDGPSGSSAETHHG